MLSIIGSLLGFASSTAPAIMDHFASKEDRKHELNKMRAMADMRKEGAELDMQFYERMGADKEHERLIQHDVSINQGVGIISGLQKSVRPVITYAFFGLFATIEIVLLMEALEKGTEFAEAIQLLWDEDTKAIFAAIISFWFGSRAVEKARKRA
jgi:hypothetical protein